MEKISLIVVLGLIKNQNGEVLVQIRNQPDFPEKHNKYEIPGGKVEYEETPEEAVVREVKEETGLDVEVDRLWPKLIVNYWTNENKTKQWKCLLISYVCRITGGELSAEPTDPRISKIEFVSPQQLTSLDFGVESDKELLLEFSKQ
jgi:mutator protein MutT